MKTVKIARTRDIADACQKRNTWHFPASENSCFCAVTKPAHRSWETGLSTPSTRRKSIEEISSANKRGTKTSGKNYISVETCQTAPVTPLHESNSNHHHHQRRSPLRESERTAGVATTGTGDKYSGKASSTPELLDSTETKSDWKIGNASEDSEELIGGKCETGAFNRKLIRASTAESVFQKFKKSITSLRFQKKTSSSLDQGQIISNLATTTNDLCLENPSSSLITATPHIVDLREENEQKPRFGSLIWRSSKERKRMNKAARNAKCNSGDSGIQIEMVPGCGSGAGGGGDSSESHDTDVPDFENSPPVVRRIRPLQQNHHHHQTKIHRPNSDLLNQILIDKLKADLRYKTTHRNLKVRRTRSDLGGRRMYNWDSRRLMSSSSPSPSRNRPKSPQKKPPEAPELRVKQRATHLRRSLSQPLDIDKLSPLMRTKAPTDFRALSEDERVSEDENMLSDSESSVASLGERKKSLETDEEMVILAEAVFDHIAIESDELAFRAGDVIEVLETTNRDWWWGSTNNKTTGWFPAQFVRLRVSQEDTVEDCLAAMASGQTPPTHLRRRTSISLLSNDQVRTSVVKELVSTERDFVKILRDIVEGFIGECRKRKDMFSAEQINTIFINLEDILTFQTEFLNDLESCIDWDCPHKSCVAGTFLKFKQGFEIYSDYCNSHPMATVLLQELYQLNNYCKFFEACRLMRGLIEIPLDGYLLTPIQRICKYPLQLAELLKYTKPEHEDYDSIVEALDAMREVAVLINERKRRMESLEKLAAWQQRVEAWEGDDLIELSSQMIHQGEVVRVKSGVWTSNITLFLFDHQLIYCKKDILKRNTYVYKGRIDLDTTEVIDVPDGKDIHIGVSVRHAVKLYSVIRDKWLLFYCRTSNEKARWLKMFAEERKSVAQDKNEKMEFTSTAKQLAKMSAKCKRRPPRKPRAHKYDPTYTGSMLQLNTGNSQYSLGRKMGTWFTFGGNKKNRHHNNPTIQYVS